jgi:hypothetical protein
VLVQELDLALALALAPAVALVLVLGGVVLVPEVVEVVGVVVT